MDKNARSLRAFDFILYTIVATVAIGAVTGVGLVVSGAMHAIW